MYALGDPSIYVTVFRSYHRKSSLLSLTHTQLKLVYANKTSQYMLGHHILKMSRYFFVAEHFRDNWGGGGRLQYLCDIFLRHSIIQP